jgi:L-lactate dehydrogenase
MSRPSSRHTVDTPRQLGLPTKSRTYRRLIKQVSAPPPFGQSKVTVVGGGQVGMAATFSLLAMGICSDLALVDVRKEAVMGERLDLLHGQAFTGRRCNIEADSSYAITKV